MLYKTKKNFERFEDIASFIKQTEKENVYLLDIGAKDGSLIYFLDSNFNYKAVDLNEEAVLKMKKRYINASVGNAEKLDFPDGCFDYVIMGEVLEHIPNIGLVLTEANRILKDDGYFIFSVPNGELKTRIYYFFKHFLKNIFQLKKEKNKKYNPKLGGHIHMFNIKHLTLLMKTFNFEVDEYIGHKANHEYIVMRCKKNVY